MRLSRAWRNWEATGFRKRCFESALCALGTDQSFRSVFKGLLSFRSAVTGFEATIGNPTGKCAFEGNVLSGLDCISLLNLHNTTFAVEAL